MASDRRSQLIRFDAGRYIVEGENELLIEGTDFNIDDQYYITGATFVILYDSDEKTEYWILEGRQSVFENGSYGTVEKAKLYAFYLSEDSGNGLVLNEAALDPVIVNTTLLSSSGRYTSLIESDVTGLIREDNVLTGDVPSLTILTVTSDTIPTSIDKESVIREDPHQRYVADYLEKEKFEQVGMVYYKDSIPSSDQD
ncbi:MAG: DUF3344 domain-containing protein [Methanobacteriota archaeon]|nr:MAG: DUF3344 domain-containing protein [Euryarchaeota archaeon]